MEKHTKPLTKVIGALGLTAALGLGVAGIAGAATGTSPSPNTHVSTTVQPQPAQDHRDSTPKSSVRAPEPTDANDNSEAAALQALAKITPDQAKQAALAAVPGSVNKVELDNENGSVVYSVQITVTGTTTDVTVDAGTGKVLAQDSGQNDGKPDTDTQNADTQNADTEKADTEQQAG